MGIFQSVIQVSVAFCLIRLEDLNSIMSLVTLAKGLFHLLDFADVERV